MNKKLFFQCAIIASALYLSACSDSDDAIGSSTGICSDCAVITSIAADFGSSAIDFAETSYPYEVKTGFAAQDLSDIRATSYGDHFYRIGRYLQDNISKWSFDNTDSSVWEFSVGAFANPYDVVFVSENKAYVLLWSDSKIWIIDPSVTGNSDAASFKTGEIDLSAYNQGTGSNAAAAILDNGYLYVLLEGLDSNYVPQTSHLVKIDTMGDFELDVNGAATAGKGYALNVKNAGDIEIFNGTIYVSGKGRYASASAGRPEPELTGGIEKVDISSDTFTSTLLVDDNHANVGAQITGFEIADATTAYLTRYNAWQNNDIIKFNPATGEVDAQPLSGYAGKDVRFIEVDGENQLWIGIGSVTAPHVDILSTVDDSLLGSVSLTRNPAAITFADTTN